LTEESVYWVSDTSIFIISDFNGQILNIVYVEGENVRLSFIFN